MPTHTRRLLLASAATGLFPGTSAATSAIDDHVIVRAAFRNRDDSWEIALTDTYAAQFMAKLNRMPLGTIVGNFHYYDTEFASEEERMLFMQLPKRFSSPMLSIHPWEYEIAIRNPEDGTFHKVSVSFNRDMLQSKQLRLFFEIWRNVWRGVPGYPLAPMTL